MRVLIVAWFFPPSNTIAAVRLGQTAWLLRELGCEVRVLTPVDPPYSQSLPACLDPAAVVQAPWFDIDAVPQAASSALKRLYGRVIPSPAPVSAPVVSGAPSGGPAAPAGRDRMSLRLRLRRFYQSLVHVPDARVGWLPAAVRAGRRLLEGWQPDVIFASGPPFTTLLIGDRLSRAGGVPLVVEFRDRWSDDPYYPPPAWRTALDRWLETRIVTRAVGLTTVSEPWAESYRRRFAKPVAVIANGYDEEDFADLEAEGWPDPACLRIVYTGGIYPGRRDPRPLFRAVAREAVLRGAVRICFYGTQPDFVWPIAAEEGVCDNVEVHGHVARDEALRQQASGDLLLLMQWDDPREQGNVPGKFFEYFGARRPILVLGLADGVPATIVAARAAGFTATDPEALAGRLLAWLAEKRRAGRIAMLPQSARAGLTRREQVGQFHRFLSNLLEDHQTPRVSRKEP